MGLHNQMPWTTLHLHVCRLHRTVAMIEVIIDVNQPEVNGQAVAQDDHQQGQNPEHCADDVASTEDIQVDIVRYTVLMYLWSQ